MSACWQAGMNLNGMLMCGSLRSTLGREAAVGFVSGNTVLCCGTVDLGTLQGLALADLGVVAGESWLPQ